MKGSWKLLCVIVGSFGSSAIQGQGVRINGSSWLQSIDLFPLQRDSVQLNTTVEVDGTRRTQDGQLVSCSAVTEWCTYLGPSSRVTTRPLIHDLSVAAWGLGEGVSFHAHGRIRAAVGGGSSGSTAGWPRIDDRGDLLDAYLEVDRPAGRLRLGRQWSLGGLGAYSYDGGSAIARFGAWEGEVLGGRALVQGINESFLSAEIGAVDDLPPENPAWLYGGRVRWRGPLSAVTATYLRVIQTDRSGLYAERAAVDASHRILGVRLGANLTYDVAGALFNEARLRASRQLIRGVDVLVDVRRHRPFFELWTVWGAFSPVGFDEVRTGASLTTAAGALTLAASGAWRTYEETETGLSGVPLRTDGWRASSDVIFAPSDAWTVNGGYGVDIGVGSSQSDATASVTRYVGDRASFGGTLSALQTIYEYRVGTGRVLGASAFASVQLRSEVQLRVDAGQYRHRLTNDAPGRDWSQRRASVRLEWMAGADPGRAR